MLSETTLKILKERLGEEKKVLEEELEKIGRRNPANPEDWEAEAPEAEDVEADSNEAADRIEEYEERTGVLKELETRYNNVQLALEKINKGAYGLCEVDNSPIEEERLLANPAARTCTKHLE